MKAILHKSILLISAVVLAPAGLAQSLDCYYGKPAQSPNLSYDTIGTLLTWLDEDGCFQAIQHTFSVSDENDEHVTGGVRSYDVIEDVFGSSEFWFNASGSDAGTYYGVGGYTSYETSEGNWVQVDEDLCNTEGYVEYQESA